MVNKLNQLNNGTIETPKSSLLSQSQYCNEFYDGADALISIEDITSTLHRLPRKVSYGPGPPLWDLTTLIDTKALPLSLSLTNIFNTGVVPSALKLSN
ncbi:hypothetical protein GJ496_004666 [Pomphorhynchus laevis]|nr:hypothetical protein GJ496_006658 [Pomphorhynchus laevis]KAI0983394.1 hypothetical protein GJ496_007321 [Pomphorhynchus laevis]KAI0990162.1 hypothetical protein GJ496_004666 [Pomphorhynchus laevis]